MNDGEFINYLTDVNMISIKTLFANSAEKAFMSTQNTSQKSTISIQFLKAYYGVRIHTLNQASFCLFKG